MTRLTATLLGFGAVLLWALLALLTARTGSIPPLQLLAMCFAVAGVSGGLAGVRRQGWRQWRQPIGVWCVGVGGLFGYHLLYVLALRAAEPVSASLIAYLWPLLIVLGAARVAGQPLRWYHRAGALLGAVGAALIVTGGADLSFQPDEVAGYALALAAAFVWAGYSLMARRFAKVSTDTITAFCLASAILSGMAHVVLEPTIVPSGPEALAALGLGLGPVGLAFFLWDIGMKRGDVALLGAASYAAPLLSTFVLIAAGLADLTANIVLACLLITGGAVLAARDLFRGRA